MATATRGCLSKIKVRDLAAATGTIGAVGGVRDWSLSEEAEDIDASEIGSCVKASVAGANSRTMSVNGFWDTATGAYQTEITVGNVLHVELYPAGSGSGNEYFETTTGGGTVLSIEKSGGVDDLVSFSATIKINGDLTTSTVP